MNEFKLQISADLKNLGKTRRFVEEAATTLDIEQNLIADLQLAVVEMVTNIILHGYQRQGGPIEIEMKRTNDTVVIRLLDQARPFDPTVVPAPDVTLPLEQRPIGGMGIYLTRKLMDTMTHRITPDGGNELTLVKNGIIGNITKEETNEHNG
jgi:serine/threonine-protein kinase RsbW